MDLGATICTPRDPKCLLCPLSAVCEARAQGRQNELPVKAPKKARPLRAGTAFWIERDGRGLAGPAAGQGHARRHARRCPTTAGTRAPTARAMRRSPGAWQAGGVVRHSFTHFDLELGLAIYAGRAPGASSRAASGGRSRELEDAGLPTLFAKAARLAAG